MSAFVALAKLWIKRGPIQCKVIPPLTPFITEGKAKQVVIVIDFE